MISIIAENSARQKQKHADYEAKRRKLKKEKQSMSQFYQGDVCLKKVNTIPPTAKKQNRPKDSLVIEYGEVTTHKHQIVDVDKCDMYLEGTRRFLEVCYAVPLIHEEHDTIVLEPGIYEIKRQRQWSVLEQMSQQVRD